MNDSSKGNEEHASQDGPGADLLESAVKQSTSKGSHDEEAIVHDVASDGPGKSHAQPNDCGEEKPINVDETGLQSGAVVQKMDEKARQGYYSQLNTEGPVLSSDFQQMDYKAQQGYYTNINGRNNNTQGLFDSDVRDTDETAQQGYYANTIVAARNPHMRDAWAYSSAQNRRAQNNPNQEQRQLANPGAYALAPLDSTGGGHPTVGADSISESSVGGQSANDHDNSGLAVATEVDEDMEGRSGHLQQAQEYHARSSQSEHHAYKTKVAMGIAWLLCLVIGAALMAYFLGQGDDSPTKEQVEEPIKEEGHSMAPSMHPLIEQVLGYFPNYTLQALQDGGSPQARAMDWLMEDPNLLEYVDLEWRVKQRFALVALYYSTRGFNWTDSQHWLSYSHHECLWFDSGEILFELPGTGDKYFRGEDLNPCHLESKDTFANDTGDGMDLIQNDPTKASYKQLWLHKNNLVGPLPEEIYWLTSLQTTSLFFNKLDGPISSEIGKLQELQASIFSFTEVSGTMPTEIGLLSNTLAFFISEYTYLDGTLPTELGRLSRMETLMIDKNQFSGPLPQDFFQMTNLEMIYLGGNSLTGTLSSSIGMLSSLEYFYMSRTSMTGTIPTEIGRLQNIQSLQIYRNLWTGGLPSEIGLCSSLVDFSFERTQMHGPIPSEIGMLSSLVKLSLYESEFNSFIPTELGLLGSVFTIEIQDNALSGSIPSEIAALPNLTHFFAQENLLTGSIPVEILDLLESNDTITLKGFNFTNNLLVDEESICWVNETYQTTRACFGEYQGLSVFPWSCECDCHC